MQRKEGQKKFYKRLLEIDSNIRGKFDPNDVQRSIRAFEIKSFTKFSMYDWLKKTKPEFNDNDFVRIYIDCKRDDLIKKIKEHSSKKSGLFLSTINRNLKSFMLAKIMAEYVLNYVPKGTHQYAKFITPYELTKMLEQSDRNHIEQKITHLNEVTADFAERRMDHSINKALAGKKIDTLEL